MGPDAVLIWVLALKVSGALLVPEVCAPPVTPDSTASPITTTRKEIRTEASLQNCSHQCLQLFDGRTVFERCDVGPHFPGGHDLLEQAPHDLAARRLGQHIGENDLLRHRDLADALGDVRAYGLPGFS